jgi:hypothetical protein
VPFPAAAPCRAPRPGSYRALNIQAGTTFCDTAFEAEVASGRLKGNTLDKIGGRIPEGACMARRLGCIVRGPSV